jgi:hypothetical protein
MGALRAGMQAMTLAVLLQVGACPSPHVLQEGGVDQAPASATNEVVRARSLMACILYGGSEHRSRVKGASP